MEQPQFTSYVTATNHKKHMLWLFTKNDPNVGRAWTLFHEEKWRSSHLIQSPAHEVLS